MHGTLPALLGIDTDRAATGVPLSDFLDGVHPEDRTRVADLVHDAHRSAGRFEAEFRTRGVDRTIHWISARGQVETDPEGRGLRCLGVALDITDTRQADALDDGDTAKIQEKLADALIAVRPLASSLDSPILQTLLDIMLYELGKSIISCQSSGQSSRTH